MASLKTNISNNIGHTEEFSEIKYGNVIGCSTITCHLLHHSPHNPKFASGNISRKCLRSFTEWVSNAKQLHASLTSTCATPSVGRGGIKHVTNEAVETCSLDWWIVLHFLSVWYTNLGVEDAMRMLPTRMPSTNCAKCKCRCRKDNGLGLSRGFGQGPMFWSWVLLQ